MYKYHLMSLVFISRPNNSRMHGCYGGQRQDWTADDALSFLLLANQELNFRENKYHFRVQGVLTEINPVEPP